MLAFHTLAPVSRSPRCSSSLCRSAASVCPRPLALRMSASASSSAKPPRAAAASAPSQKPDREVAITPRAADYSQWYQNVISSAELAESSPVKGCLIVKPHGYAIWEAIRDALDLRIKASGARNAYFPLLIPQSFLSREAEHVDGFAKECAVVTHHRLRAVPDGAPGALEADPDARLEEPLVIRPTSETIIWHAFARWVSSYRDLPLCINQWANVVRWEMRTRPFLRTTEFLWQEGHTAHASAADAHAKAEQMIDVYADVARDVLAMPVVRGVKSPTERFAGADETYTIEALMQNGWALQAGTSHYLGQNFPRAFDVTYTDSDGEARLAWGTSWGVTTRLIGALIMTHSDDTGLVLPPPVAPIQVALVLIFKNDEQRAAVLAFAHEVRARLEGMGVRVALDDREKMRPGAKYFEWERKGVPLRMEIGPKDAAKRAVFAARRVGGDKRSLPLDDAFETETRALLDGIHAELLASAQHRLEERTIRVHSYDDMKARLRKDGDSGADGDEGGDGLGGLYVAPWKCDAENERRVKEETMATLRCYPTHLQAECVGKKCFLSGEDATHMAMFARAY